MVYKEYNIKRIFIAFVALLLFSNVCHAAPVISSVSDTVKNGEIISINGSSFGDKLNANPIRYDDFEGMTVGDTLDKATGWWSVVEHTYKPMISSDNQRNKDSSKNLKCYSKDSQNSIAYKNNIGFANTGKILFSTWVRWDWGNVTYDSRYQIKSWRIPASVASNGGVTYPDFAAFNWWYDKNGGYSVHYVQNHLGEDSGSNTEYFNSNVLRQDRWYHIMIQADMGTPGKTDGSWWIWTSSADFSSIYSKITQENCLVMVEGSNLLDAVKLDNYLDDGDGTLTLYWDDIYIDNSWARVEIGNASSYDNCTHREIQIPTSWSSDSISIKINTGSFNSGDGVYLFVVDSEGNTSSGYKIIIGDDSGIKPPQNVRLSEN
ncbi:exported hypothetical protein [Desulfosarcina cetonica]|uniref:hypothetical protein n=1 Tax=Desulfosarcina cetonica TaxID=90730 RepID=UPI000A78FBA5|nr:hypothetical protein [Desulfosarcina cetonica]VTR64174.1 exported hypothetical protein [Desulfosarcina cetonica]